MTTPWPEPVLDKCRKAHSQLAANIVPVHGFGPPVLTEGGGYNGIWLECGPLEGLVYGRWRPDVARTNHEVFFHHQKPDGQFPAWIVKKLGFGQIQMVVPIAATALETADLLGGDEAFLARAYDACGRWDAWLARHRDTRGTGLCEAFCEYDTGHDNSPRFTGVRKDCPNEDARQCPDTGRVPYLAPDLSATVYGGRIALADMADRLNRPAEARQWLDLAQRTRAALIRHCWDPADECFYDVDRDGQFVRIRSDLLSRVCSEHVPDQAMFNRLWERHLGRPESFWTPYPLPSVAVDDPAFVRALPRNSWGGASQALTALRTPRWFFHYDRAEQWRHLANQWITGITAAPEFMQQMNPWTGEFSTAAGYSPSALVLVDFVRRLEQP